jgi:quinol monooxygenase YgiN
MAIAMLVDVPGLTREQFETAARQAKQAGPQPGMLYHAAGPMNGGYRIVEVWDSQDAADAFYRSAHYRQATATLVMQPTITTWPVYALDDGSGWRQIP